MIVSEYQVRPVAVKHFVIVLLVLIKHY